MNTESYLKIVRPFGPSLGIVTMPKNLIDIINDFVDNQVVNNKTKAEELDAGPELVGQVTQEINLPKEIIEGSLYEFLFKSTIAYIKLSINKEVKQFELLSAWVVRQFKNEYNPIHFHSGHISGAGYLKVPDNFGDTIMRFNIDNQVKIANIKFRENYLNIEVKLHSDMNNLNNVYVIESLNIEEFKNINK